MVRELVLTNNKKGMTMEHEAIGVLKWLSGIVLAMIGYFVKLNHDEVKELKAKHTNLSEEVDAINVLVAGNYVKRSEFNEVVLSIDKKLDKIFDKIDSKEDKKRQ